MSESSRHPLRTSLFPETAPYLRILEAGQSYDPPLPEELAGVALAAPNGLSPIVEENFMQAGLSLLKTDSPSVACRWETLPITEKGRDEINFSLRPDQKINQFPGLYVIGRKDYLWTSYHAMLQVATAIAWYRPDVSLCRNMEPSISTSWLAATSCLTTRRSASQP